MQGSDVQRAVQRARHAASQARRAADARAQRDRLRETLVREMFARPVRDYAHRNAGRPVRVLRAGFGASPDELGLSQLRDRGYEITVVTVDQAIPGAPVPATTGPAGTSGSGTCGRCRSRRARSTSCTARCCSTASGTSSWCSIASSRRCGRAGSCCCASATGTAPSACSTGGCRGRPGACCGPGWASGTPRRRAALVRCSVVSRGVREGRLRSRDPGVRADARAVRHAA